MNAASSQGARALKTCYNYGSILSVVNALASLWPGSPDPDRARRREVGVSRLKLGMLGTIQHVGKYCESVSETYEFREAGLAGDGHSGVWWLRCKGWGMCVLEGVLSGSRVAYLHWR